MSSKFRFSASYPIRWPYKCATCGANATATHEIRATAGLLYAISAYRIKYLAISYPICTKHKYITKVMRLLMFISFFAIFMTGFVVFGTIFGENPSWLKNNFFGVITIFIFAISIIAFLYLYKLQPVRLTSQGSKSFIITIRNDQYATEFGMHNNLLEKGTGERKRYQFHNLL